MCETAIAYSNKTNANCTTFADNLTMSGSYFGGTSSTAASVSNICYCSSTPCKHYNPDKFGNFSAPGSFAYLDKDKNLKEVYIKQVVYQNPATIVFWNDGTKTVSKCHKGDEYSPEAGLVLCILKKTQGRTLKGLFEAWIPEQAFAQPNKSVIQTLKNVRRLIKKSK